MAVVTFIFAATGTWGLAIAGALALGGGYGIFIAASQALSTLVLPDPGSAARDLGIMNIASALPQAVGPPLAALVIFLGAGYRGLFACAGAMLLGAAFVFSRIRERQ
jgi:fucose permease